jgi:hypothetical protein
MARYLRSSVLVLGLACVLALPGLSAAQQLRKFPSTPPPTPFPGNFNNANPANNAAQPPIVGFNVSQPNAGGTNLGALLNNGGNGFGNTNPLGVNAYGFNSSFQNPYASLFNNPYAPPYNPYVNPYNNPYSFWGTGYPTGSYNPLYSMNPAAMYNYNFNMQYLTNPYLNPMSNPAFSGPFPPNPFNAMGALNAMGLGNLLQSFPLPNAMPGNGAGNNQAFP